MAPGPHYVTVPNVAAQQLMFQILTNWLRRTWTENQSMELISSSNSTSFLIDLYILLNKLILYFSNSLYVILKITNITHFCLFEQTFAIFVCRILQSQKTLHYCYVITQTSHSISLSITLSHVYSQWIMISHEE